MRPLVKRAPHGHRYTVPSPPRYPAPESAPQRGEPRAKLTEDDVREARAWHREGRFGVGQLAYIFDVSPSNMSAVINRHSWKHVEDDV